MRKMLFYITILFSFTSIAFSQVPKQVWGYVYNSDASSPATNDIQITAYLQKNPTSTHVFNNIGNVWSFDVNTVWGFYPGGDGGPTNANLGDILVLDFFNVSGGTFDGETGHQEGALDINSPQQFGPNDYSLPVEISVFKAENANDYILIKWRTESEIENLGFNLLRKLNEDSLWKKINLKLIEGAGTTSEQNDYFYEDKEILNEFVYNYKLEAIDYNGAKSYFGPISIKAIIHEIPETYALFQNYPNPFNPSTTIKYQLPLTENIILEVFTVLGQKVITLIDQIQKPGYYSISWNGKNINGVNVASGIYI